jgi:AraC-like DNA-binding protein
MRSKLSLPPAVNVKMRVTFCGLCSRSSTALTWPASGANRRYAALVEKTKALLLRRFAEPLSLAELAQAAGSSPFHLARLFCRHTGFSLHGYRTRLRLLHALDRLEESRGALADLALELGFSSQSHFTDAFTKAFGVPPGAVGRDRRRRAV